MDALTARQTQILKTLIDEYIETATPVGSLALEKKYNLGISPATIRNEMMALTKMGFLKQPHTSAGRIPTSNAMKFYINQLMEEKQLGLTEEVKAKEQVWDSRNDFDDLMDSVTRALSEKTRALAVATTFGGSSWSYGYSQVFNAPELIDYHVCQSLFELLEQEKRMQDLFFKRLTGRTPIEVLFGDELGLDFLDPIGIVAARFQAGDKQGAIGVVGPFGLNYPSIIPTVRYFSNLVQELLK